MGVEGFDHVGYEGKVRLEREMADRKRKERAEVRARFPQAERDRKKWRKVGRGVREVRKLADDKDNDQFNSDDDPAPQMIFKDGKFLIDVTSLGKNHVHEGFFFLFFFLFLNIQIISIFSFSKLTNRHQQRRMCLTLAQKLPMHRSLTSSGMLAA